MSETNDDYVICPHCGFKNMKPDFGYHEGFLREDTICIVQMIRIKCSFCGGWYISKQRVVKWEDDHYVHMIFCTTCHRWKFVLDGKCETCGTPIVTEEKGNNSSENY